MNIRELLEIYIETAISLQPFKQGVECDIKDDVIPLRNELKNNLGYYKEKYKFTSIEETYIPDSFCCFVKDNVLKY